MLNAQKCFLFLRNHPRHQALLMAGVLLVDESLLCSGVYGLVCLWQHLGCLSHVAFLHEIHEFLHHRLQLCLIGLQTCVTHLVLAHTLDGGLDDWHRFAVRKTLEKARIA